PFPSSEIRWSARSPSVTVRGHSCSRRRISRATTRSTTATCDPPGSDLPRCETPSRSSRSTRTAAAPPRSSGEPMNGRALAPLYVAHAAFALALATPPGDPDTYWHLASGKWMVDHGALLRTDVFSSTVNGQPYSVGEWLGEIVLYLAYFAGGWTGLVILRGLLVAVAAFFLTRVALRGGAPVIVAVPVSCAALLLSEIVWTDRPHLFTLALRGGGTLLDLMLLAPLLWLGMSAQRQMPYFAFAAVPYIATALPRAWPPLERWLARRRPYPRAAIVGFGAGVVAMAVVGLAFVPNAPNERAYPTAALDAVRSGSGLLLNEYDWGGYLIWRAPERPVFVDGRLFPFVPDVFADWREAVELGPRWKDVLDRYKVAQVLLRPDRALVSALREQGWRVVREDALAVLLERPR